MNDRVNEELLAEAAGRAAVDAVARARTGEVITAEYEGHAFLFRADGWFNATLVAKRYGKRPVDWLNLDETKEYLSALKELDSNCEPGSLLETRRGRYNSGTWMHPQLAIPFARWVNIRFSVWCDNQIRQILAGKLPAEMEDRLTTAGERMPFLFAALHSLDRRGTSVTVFYRAVNKAAGSTKFSKMTISQRNKVLPVAERINHHIDTQDDWCLLHDNGVKLSVQQAQLALPLHDPPAED